MYSECIRSVVFGKMKSIQEVFERVWRSCRNHQFEIFKRHRRGTPKAVSNRTAHLGGFGDLSHQNDFTVSSLGETTNDVKHVHSGLFSLALRFARSHQALWLSPSRRFLFFKPKRMQRDPRDCATDEPDLIHDSRSPGDRKRWQTTFYH